jgi:hypothetical protein
MQAWITIPPGCLVRRSPVEDMVALAVSLTVQSQVALGYSELEALIWSDVLTFTAAPLGVTLITNTGGPGGGGGVMGKSMALEHALTTSNRTRQGGR